MNIFIMAYLNRIAAIFLLVILLLLPGTADAENMTPAFPEGETLIYNLRWAFIHAGQARLKVMPVTEKEHQPARHFILTARTTPFIDNIYKVRSKIQSYTDVPMTRSIFYEKKQHEGSRKRDVTVFFDWDKHRARYFNYQQLQKTISLKPGSFDPLGAFFFVRNTPLDGKTIIERPITDGKKNVIGQAEIIGRETVTVPSGTYDTYKVAPDLRHVGGVFRATRDAKIHVWFTSDDRQVPVKITSKVIVGHFVAELVSDSGSAALNGMAKND